MFAEALNATASHRSAADQIADIPGILHNIETSAELKPMWDKYRKQFAYTEKITYEQIVDVPKALTA